MIAAILAFLGFNRNETVLSPEDLRASLRFEKRRHKAPEVDSEAQMLAFFADKPGGYDVVVDRRKEYHLVPVERRKGD